MLSALEHTPAGQHSAPGHTHTHTDPAGLQDTPGDTAWEIPVNLPLTTDELPSDRMRRRRRYEEDFLLVFVGEANRNQLRCEIKYNQFSMTVAIFHKNYICMKVCFHHRIIK